MHQGFQSFQARNSKSPTYQDLTGLSRFKKKVAIRQHCRIRQLQKRLWCRLYNIDKIAITLEDLLTYICDA
jgi:hypothetical protein